MMRKDETKEEKNRMRGKSCRGGEKKNQLMKVHGVTTPEKQKSSILD